MANTDSREGFWTAIFKTVFKGYRHFIPAVIITWIMVEVAAPQVPKAPAVAQTGLFLLCMSFYLAAAARAIGITCSNPLTLALSRAGICIEPMMLAFAMGIISFFCFVVFLYQANAIVDAAVIATGVLVNLYILARGWPVWGIPFFFEGKIRWSPAARASVWHGPGLGLALRVTKKHGILNAHSRRFLLGFVVVSTVGFLIKWFLPGNLLFDLVVYPLGIPVLSAATLQGTRELLEL